MVIGTYTRTIIYEFTAACMAALAISFNSKFNSIWPNDFKLGIFILMLSFSFTILFGVSIGLLSSNSDKCVKKELYIDAFIRIVLAITFIIWVIAVLKFGMKISSYVLANFEGVMRYGAIMVGANIISGVQNLIKGRKIIKTSE